MTDPRMEKTLARALELFQRRDWTGAMKALEAAVQADPENPRVWLERGRVLNRLARFEEALESFDRAIGLAPLHAEAWYQRGLALTKLGRMQEALDAFQRARESGSESGPPQPGVPMDFFLRGLARGEELAEELERGHSDVYSDDKHGFSLDLRFRWDDGSEDRLIIRQVSESVIEAVSDRYPSCWMSIEARARVPCDYPAKELARDLACEIAGAAGRMHFYVFPNGLLPAYAACVPQSEGKEAFEDIVVSGRFAYRLRRVVVQDKASEEFAHRIIANFYPLAGPESGS